MRKKFIVTAFGGLILGITIYAGFKSYERTSSTTENDLLLANIEALAGGESGNEGYIVHHMACVNKDKIPTGKYLAYCYKGGHDPEHEHKCSDCSKL